MDGQLVASPQVEADHADARPELLFGSGAAMRRFNDLPIGVRLASGFGITIVLMLAVGGVAMRTDAIAQKGVEDGRKSFQSAKTAELLKADILRVELAERALTGAAGVGHADALDTAVAQFQARWERASKEDITPQERAQLQRSKQAFDDYVAGVRALNATLAPAEVAARDEAAVDTDPVIEQVDEYATEIVSSDVARGDRDSDEASSLRRVAEVVILLALVVSVLIGLVLTRSVTRPISRMVALLDRVANRDLRDRVEVTNHDEVGKMAVALNVSLEQMASTLQLISESSRLLASASEELSNMSGRMEGAAQLTTSESSAVAAAAEEVSRSVDTVAAASEEMSASIREISANATRATRVAATAVAAAGEATETVARLSASSAEISSVLDAITTIAEQTNLLALNATIEAARAGEAGKGFAVVASEVKDLSQSTSRATEEVSARIATLQADAEAAVAAITRITEVIGEIDETQSTIASAVEQQSATTAEIGSNVNDTALASTQIARGISTVASTASDTADGARGTNEAAGDLAKLAGELDALVREFSLV
jgi:methyl-accepting chemotaxis protein